MTFQLTSLEFHGQILAFPIQRLAYTWHMGILPPPPNPPPRKLYHMANIPPEGILYGKPSAGRNPMAELPQGEIIPYGKLPPPPPPGRNLMAELPQGGGAIPYGKPPPSMANLLQHKFHGGGTNTWGGGGGGGEKSHRWGTFIREEGNPWGGGGRKSHVIPTWGVFNHRDRIGLITIAIPIWVSFVE